ncbi:MAG: SEL1-like repeat protein, partial [Pseudaminobacter sp.]|nr:SEL1-like repeat protein [Pseudaminobacter sp.]
RDTILEAARQAAENAVRSLDGSASQTAAVSGLAQDLKVLETLTRRSDERNSKTFEAIHDTLIKIVDRLGSLESSEPDGEDARQQAAPRIMTLPDAPSIDFDQTMPLAGDMTDTDMRTEMVRREPSGRTPAEAAAAAAVAALGSDGADKAEPASPSRSMLGGLSRVFSKKNKEQPVVAAEPMTAPDLEAPSIGLDEPLDPKLANRPLEPGSGAPDLAAIMKRVRDERGQTPKGAEPDAAKSDFIAAARRAAQAAAAEAEMMKRKSDVSGPVRALRIGDLLKKRRKTVLMATATIMLALAGLQLGKAFLADSDEVTAVEPASLVAQQVETASLEPSAEMTESSAGAAEQGEAVRPVEPAEAPKAATAPEITTPAAEPEAVTPVVAEPEETAPAEAAGDTVRSIPVAPVTAATDPLPAAEPLSTDSALAAEPAPTLPEISVPLEAGPVALREAAEAGDAKALFEIGARYAEGRGVKTDNAQAAQWYEKSAEMGFAPAQYRIGNFYEKAIGVGRDIQKSKTWYQLAAAQGNASAMHNLAVLFAMGADGTADNESAARWFTDAAELGVKDSQFNLGILAAKGVGAEQSLEDSYKWFALVAKTGDRDAAAKRDEVANSLRPEQLERARAAAELWKPKPLDPQSNSAEIPASWQESTTTTASVDMKKAVQNIQSILNKNGYEAGEPDGVMGGKTKTAIIAFQKDNDMEASGKVDEKLVRALLARK